MELQVQGQFQHQADYLLGHGNEFRLEPGDERELPRRMADGETATGSYYHGMRTAVEDNTISTGIVHRVVVKAGEVNVETNCLIMSPKDRGIYENVVVAKGFTNPPVWAKCVRDTRANAMCEALTIGNRTPLSMQRRCVPI